VNLRSWPKWLRRMADACGVMDETRNAHVCSGDASLTTSCQYLSHVVELTLLVIGTRCHPVIKNVQRHVYAPSQFCNLLQFAVCGALARASYLLERLTAGLITCRSRRMLTPQRTICARPRYTLTPSDNANTRRSVPRIVHFLATHSDRGRLPLTLDIRRSVPFTDAWHLWAEAHRTGRSARLERSLMPM
jgi:hypothetical protein